MKYILEIKPEYEDSFKGVMILGTKDDNLFVDTLAVENLEELNSDYINEHYGSLQDDAYQRGLEDGKQIAVGAAELREKLEYQKGFEDGKAQVERGCDGCKYAGKVVTDPPCITCCNSYKNQWTAKDDEIVVGDEVIWTQDEIAIVVTCVYTKNGIEWCDGICRDGNVYSILTENARKTGRHFDIDKILEVIQHD